ncbi:hypoxanthine phosphoribosyltransferase [Corynebacterium sp. 320]|uniref:Hypoxanthine phosphoribosyltransferase n=1 Tax=Corynebacterium zhongnanshanii TaxID=2768834 RepID=A0ABQ6VCT5_9CORY|nr:MULTISPECIES: hypoxanthine phosphoribosyltransferase [Corynebacterium]KAB1503066.1 hypoxanthine phosphoribosyltransferase [Corynebacterium sp. 320]KAB1550723.1 hypoxanthine phosphoribosyltransferase [Corynebacterium sp. 321]KAB1551082.1 hypoxanthine phosphoribosyltransferase [Corynebacterium sp. 319]KAB3519860.1 hypoxanthine phosphoribosyltransferase [Corynebacterium zhongnanshanii]KAB3526863.1 hypoxanthine phosphoribosyltransferase [Corynebacterium sp. 250]
MSDQPRSAGHSDKDSNVPANAYGDDIESVLITEEELQTRIQEMADRLSERFKDEDEDLILLCVLKGAVFFITDFARAMNIPTQIEFMAVSSYGNSTRSSGVVRILKDLDREIAGRNVIIVEDIIDSGLTLSWLLRNLKNRQPKSLGVVSLLRKAEAVKVDIELEDLGFDIPNEFVVGYGLDFAERYRDVPFIGTLRPSVYE